MTQLQIAHRTRTGLLTASLMLVGLAQAGLAQDVKARLAADREILAKETYEVPPPELLKLATAPWHNNYVLSNPSPDLKFFLREVPESVTSVTSYGKAHVWLGGLTIDPKAGRARSLTTRGSAALIISDATTGKGTRIDAPKGSMISASRWSPDSKQIAFIASFDDASYLCVADIATGRPTQLVKLLPTISTSVEWTPDGKGILAVVVPDNRKPEPKRPEIATGPDVRLWTSGMKDNERYHFSLLEDPFDGQLLEWYATGQLAVIDVKTKAVKKVGGPAMVRGFNVSPDGQYVRVTMVTKPFSYVVPFSSFGSLEELWDMNGRVLAEVEKRPVQLEGDTASASARANAPGHKKSLTWMPAGPGLSYIDAAPADTANKDNSGGNGRKERVGQWLPPFGPSDAKVLYENDGPISQAVFSNDAKMLFIATSSKGSGEVFAVNLSAPTQRHIIVKGKGYTPSFGRGGGGGAGAAGDSAAFYGNPGSVVTKRGTSGVNVAMITADGSVFLEGMRYFPDLVHNPPHEFLDKVNIVSGAKTRVYEGPSDASESLATPLDDEFSKVVVNRESPTQVSDSYLLDTRSGSRSKLTNNVNYAPEFTGATRKRLTATRADGVHFVVDVVFPPGYQMGTRLPGMFWFYPGEYTDQAGYDRRTRTDNVNRFPAVSSRQIQYFVMQGYLVAEFNPPIIGEAGRMNDNYVSDLRMNLAAVIDELDKDGYLDRARVAIGGHSYGAFSTANALVNTPFFKAGIAGDGMYNRTLTPTGFQSERRNFWAAQKTYLDMSPMLQADKMQGALLMYHGKEDTNFGTNPISSVRMMQSLRATGKNAALYMYPYEDHGPATVESDLDLWARWSAWLDIYVKNAEAEKTAVVP